MRERVKINIAMCAFPRVFSSFDFSKGHKTPITDGTNSNPLSFVQLYLYEETDLN